MHFQQLGKEGRKVTKEENQVEILRLRRLMGKGKISSGPGKDLIRNRQQMNQANLIVVSSI